MPDRKFAPRPLPKPTGSFRDDPLYGRGYEGHPHFQATPDMAPAALQSGRSAIAGRGFDPSRMNLLGGLLTQGKRELAGRYDANEDRIDLSQYSDTKQVIGGAGTVTHEAIHRGLRKAKAYVGAKPATGSLYHRENYGPLARAFTDHDFEETLARTLEHQLAGTTPIEFEMKKWPEINAPETLAALEELESILTTMNAVEYDAGRGRRGGPR